jgi:Na+/melibiose symporter-like transporter
MNEQKKKKKDRVHSLRGRLLYSLGAIPSSLPYQIVGSYIAIYYEKDLGLAAGLFGLLWLFYGIWNAINDPLMGYVMDKYKTKWGRRVPYIVVGTIPFTIGFIFLWWVPMTDQLGIFTHALIFLFLFDLGFTIAMTAWTALYTEMYEDEKERATTVAIDRSINNFYNCRGNWLATRGRIFWNFYPGYDVSIAFRYAGKRGIPN